MKTFVASLVVGIVLTFGLFGLGYLANDSGHYALSYFAYWQAWAMQMSLPCWSMAAGGEPLCRDPAVSKVVFYGGLPLGIFIYTALTYAVLSWRKRRAARAGAPSAAAAPHPGDTA